MSTTTKKKSLKSVLLEDCCFNRGSLKFVPEGGEILKYIGCDVFHIKLTRDNSESPWKVDQKMVRILDISDWEPMSGTYKTTYTDFTDTFEMRMIPEGFQFENSEETNNMERFVPMSIHFTLTELDIFFKRLENLFKERPILPIEALKKIQESKQEEQLGYFHNVALLIDNPEHGICYVRIYKMTPLVKIDKEWKFSVQDKDGNVIPLKIHEEKEVQNFYLNGENLGEFKIIDIV